MLLIMKLDQDAINKLREVFRADYADDLTDSEAEEIGSRLIRLAELLRHPQATDGRNIPPPQVHRRGF